MFLFRVCPLADSFAERGGKGLSSLDVVLRLIFLTCCYIAVTHRDGHFEEHVLTNLTRYTLVLTLCCE